LVQELGGEGKEGILTEGRGGEGRDFNIILLFYP